MDDVTVRKKRKPAAPISFVNIHLLTCCLSAATVMKAKTLTVTHADDETSSTTTDKLQQKHPH